MEARVSRVVEAMPSLVPFVAPETLEDQLGVRFRLRMGANESAFGPSPLALEAMRAAAGRAAWYGDPQCLQLREALAAKLGLAVAQITVGSGIDELLILLCRAYLDPGDAVVTTLGSYPTFEFAAFGAGGELVRLPYRDDAPDLSGLADAAQAAEARLVYLANPDNPSGAFHDAGEVRAFRARLPDGCLLVLDEAYADFVPEGDLPIFDGDDPSVVRLRTFSKAHGLAGARVGFAIGHPSIGRTLQKVRPHFGVNAMGQAGALASLHDREHLAAAVAATAAGRAELAAIVERLGFATRPSATNFVIFDAGSRLEADGLLDRLLRAGVFVRKPGQPPLDRFVRVTVGTPEDHAEFAAVLERVREKTL
ncbi:MAG: aminotransferase class I/II-fold pyridoxal phosphate-dependent enzyme [Fimbriimonas sp.]